MQPPRETFASKYGFLAASTSVMAGIGTMTVLGFRAIAWGSGAFMLWFILGYIIIGITLQLIDSALGYWSRRAAPQAWALVSKNNPFYVWLIWLMTTNGLLFFVTWYSVLLGVYLDYAISAPLRFWGDSPGSFFWDHYGLTLRPLGFGLLLWVIAWFVMYKSVNSWVRFALWAKPITTIILIILFVWSLTNFPNWPNAWGQVFSFKPAQFLTFVAFTQALLWVFWRSAVGLGNMVAFASYLPKGSDITTTILLAGFWDILVVVLAAMTLPVLALGAGIPPIFAGSIGLAFSGLPQAWNVTAPTGLVIAVLFYIIAIPAAYPLMVAFTEAFAAALMDELGWPRSRTISFIFLVGVPLIVLYSLPIYDAVNGNSWGFTLLFAALYWEALLPAFVVLAELIMVRRYLGFDKILDILNENSTIKLSKGLFKSLVYVAFLFILLTVAYLLSGTLGLFGIQPYDAGTLLYDGTANHYADLAGIGIIFMQVGVPALVGLAAARRSR